MINAIFEEAGRKTAPLNSSRFQVCSRFAARTTTHVDAGAILYPGLPRRALKQNAP